MNDKKQTLAVLTGAGMSAESGIPTFRGPDGLWEGHRVEDVATPDAWVRHPALVLDFYNQRRRKLSQVLPNAGHLGLAALQEHFDVRIITQNVDDLHGRAGSLHVLHLHGLLTQARGTHAGLGEAGNEISDIGYRDITLGDTCPRGSQLRPHIVWFGEDVPMMERAIEIVESASLFVVIGTSLAVYPASGLVDYVPRDTPVYLIDPEPRMKHRNMRQIAAGASEGVRQLQKILITPVEDGRPAGDQKIMGRIC